MATYSTDNHNSCESDEETPARFELLAKLGDGSVGSVYKAWDSVLRKHVALKILNPGNDANIEIARREVLYAQQLQHPGFIRIHDVVEHAGVTCISMEYVDGKTLRSLLISDVPLPPVFVSELGIQICDALSYAHSAGIAHCDIKPENILLDNGRVRLADFGHSISFASRVDASQTRGTPGYMSPEQKQALPVDHLTDIYSLGLVLAEATIGRRLSLEELGSVGVEAIQDAMSDVPPALKDVIDASSLSRNIVLLLPIRLQLRYEGFPEAGDSSSRITFC
jgi:eukaryotic-like serine/threonine-protein kinase